jgi:hypothetical protein
MSDILSKDFVLGVPEHGGSPAIPPSPPYTIMTPEYGAPHLVHTRIHLPDGSWLEFDWMSPGEAILVPHTYPGYPGLPAIPPVPAIAANFHLGWNAKASSIGSFVADGMYQFTVPVDAIGVITGFNDTDVGTGYAQIEHGIYCHSGVFQVVEAGAILGAPAAYVAGDVFTIARLGTEVRYFLNSSLEYTSLNPSTGPVYAHACLFFGGDSVQ